MTFYALGLNHEQASVTEADSFALDAEDQWDLYDGLILSEEAEVVVLSTCNRTEAYLYGREADVHRLERALANAAGTSWPAGTPFHRQNEAAVRHVLHVTAGLKSMVPGDQQILAQMKEAYQRAVDAGMVHSLVHRLLHTAFRAAKRVSTETALSQGAASVSSASVEMARHYFQQQGAAAPLREADVLLVGAGEMGQLALKALRDDAPASIAVTNRSSDRAQGLAEEYDAVTVPWEERHRRVANVDLAIVATGAEEPILESDALPTRSPSDVPPLLVDIARPRNVDQEVDERSDYTVYDLDDLQQWAEQVRANRSTSIPDAEAICDDLLSDFVTWVFHQQALQPAIQAIRQTFESIRTQEVDRHAHRTDMDREEVDRLTKSIMQKLLAVPIVRLKNVDPDSIDFAQGIQLLHALFAPSDGEGRSLPEASPEDQPSLAEAPSHCPYLTHDPGEASADGDPLHEALRMAEEDEEKVRLEDAADESAQ